MSRHAIVTAPIDRRPVAPIYLEHECLAFWARTEAVRNDPAWKEKVFWARLLLCTGVRIEEATQILVSDCDENSVFIFEGKGKKSRECEIWPCFQDHYTEYIQECRSLNQVYLFPGKRVKRWDVRKRGSRHKGGICVRLGRNWWREVVVDLCLLRYLPPHHARKTHLSWSALVLDEFKMKKQSGHTKIKTTDVHYIFSIPGTRFRKIENPWYMEEGT